MNKYIERYIDLLNHNDAFKAITALISLFIVTFTLVPLLILLTIATKGLFLVILFCVFSIFCVTVTIKNLLKG